MKDSTESKGEFPSVERDVLTGVARKVGTAVGTVVSALSRTKAEGSKKTITGRSHSVGAKTSRRRSQTKPGKAESEHSSLKRRRKKSKSAR
jgi:hypothetical protein